MKKIRGISFYQNHIKFITMELYKNKWILTDYGEMPFRQRENDPTKLFWTNKYRNFLSKSKLIKNNAYITIEAQHTYLNKRTIMTSEKVSYKDIIELNYKNIIPILFEKNMFTFDYSIRYCEQAKTTDICFLAMDKEKIDYIYESCISLNADPLMLSPSYKYLTDILKKFRHHKYTAENIIYIESTRSTLTLVLIQNKNPILKRSIEFNDDLRLNIKQYLYYLKNYLMINNILILSNNIDKKLETLMLECVTELYEGSHCKVMDFLKEIPWISEVKKEILLSFQDCFIAVGGILLDESIKIDNQCR